MRSRENQSNNKLAGLRVSEGCRPSNADFKGAVCYGYREQNFEADHNPSIHYDSICISESNGISHFFLFPLLRSFLDHSAATVKIRLFC